MPKVVKVTDQPELVSTSQYDYAKFPFENFNVVQSRLFEFFDQDANAVIAAKTSAGKTVCAEMLLAHEVRKRGGKGMYLAPLKALASEKLDDWTEKDHHFGDLNVSICTGDYMLTADRKKELERSNLIVMSSEMLNSRGRNHTSENNNWMMDVGTLVVDEAHLLTVPGRGDHLESGLIKYAKMNPNGKIILLSATMPNVDEITEWVSHLNGHDSYLLESKYRPCPLYEHYELFEDKVYSYEEREMQKVWAAMNILEEHTDDKFLVFVHTKKTGDMMQKMLKKAGFNSEYHNADLDKKKRKEVEKRFKTDPDLRVVVATSTLAWGLNLPARRVIVLGTERGMSPVATYDIDQMKGRAGRPQFDPCGDVYVLLPRTKAKEEMKRLQAPQHIQSQMFDEKNPNYKVLGFHLVSEIHKGDVKTHGDVHEWYGNTLAAFQAKQLKQDVVEGVMTGLEKCGAIRKEDEEYSTTSLGRVASMFYFSPWDVSDLARNFGRLFKAGKEKDDTWVALALANTDSHRPNFVSNAEKEEVDAFFAKLHHTDAVNVVQGSVMMGAAKAAYCYHMLLKGLNSQTFAGLQNTLRYDSGRTIQVLNAIDSMVGKWGKKEFFRELHLRIVYGVEHELLSIIKLEGIGRVKARKLYDVGLTTYRKVADNPNKVMLALECSPKVASKIVENAKQLADQGE